jgi:hypothetical protein
MGIVVSPIRSIELTALGYANNPFVAWENLGADATLSGTSPETGGDRANAVSGSTYDKFRAVEDGGAVVLAFDLGAAAVVGFAALAAHNLGTLGATVQVMYSDDGVTYTDAGAGAVAATDNKPIVFRLAWGATARRYWRFYITGLDTDAQVGIGAAFLGKEIIFPRRMYQGFSPVLTPTEVQLQSNVSVGGELLGSSVISRGATLAVDLTYIPASFVRSDDWLAFQAAFGEGQPFFFGWRPDKYAQDVYYCARSDAVIRPSNTGPLDLMGISFSARVYANG